MPAKRLPPLKVRPIPKPEYRFGEEAKSTMIPRPPRPQRRDDGYTEGAIIHMLASIDRRLRLVELYLSARQNLPRIPVALDAEGRPKRGRPKGSQSLPKIEVGPPLFDENTLNARELVTHRVVEGWARASRPRREGLLCNQVEDAAAWKAPAFRRNNDNATRAWHHLTMLRAYAAQNGMLAAFAEVVKLAENVPVDDPAQLRRGLALALGYIELGRVPRNAAELPLARDAAA